MVLEEGHYNCYRIHSGIICINQNARKYESRNRRTDGILLIRKLADMKKTKEQISFNMKQVKNKDSEIEVLLRHALWAKGVRYRKNVNGMFGHPDIAWKGKKVVVFIDSEFWHGYDWDNRKKDFKSNLDFWIPKIERNIQRDIEVNHHYKENGWTVLRFWGRDVKKNLDGCVQAVMGAIGKNDGET